MGSVPLLQASRPDPRGCAWASWAPGREKGERAHPAAPVPEPPFPVTGSHDGVTWPALSTGRGKQLAGPASGLRRGDRKELEGGDEWEPAEPLGRWAPRQWSAAGRVGAPAEGCFLRRVTFSTWNSPVPTYRGREPGVSQGSPMAPLVSLRRLTPARQMPSPRAGAGGAGISGPSGLCLRRPPALPSSAPACTSAF